MRAAAAIRAAAVLLLVWGVAGGQQPARPFTVVVLPAAIRDSMSAIWSATNRGWDDSTDMTISGPRSRIPKPTGAYFGCLSGDASGDTLWVRHLVPATELRRGELSVTGDCSKVAERIGTWHTHPYRAGFKGHVIKVRGLSGSDFKRFAASGDLVTIVMWDADSLDVATKEPEGDLRHPVPYIIH